MNKLFLSGLALACLPFAAWGQTNNKAADLKNADVLPIIRDSISAPALKNLTTPEQAFCYTVDTAEPDEDGYLIDGMAVTGFCGILSASEISLFSDQFLSREENISSTVANCLIKPRIMLRFVRGVDYTDVLFSSPCQSLTVFYAGQIKSYNFAPGAEVVDVIIDAYEEKKMNFISPSLLKQVLPIGVLQTDEDRNLIRQTTVKQPVRNWTVKESAETPEKTPTRKGWNRLNSANRS